MKGQKGSMGTATQRKFGCETCNTNGCFGGGCHLVWEAEESLEKNPHPRDVKPRWNTGE